MAAEYQDAYGDHDYDEVGNYIGPGFEEAAATHEGTVSEAPSADPTPQAAATVETDQEPPG